MSHKRPVLIFPDSLSTRLFFSCSIVHRLHDALSGELDVLSTYDVDKYIDSELRQHASADIAVCRTADVFPVAKLPLAGRIWAAFDDWFEEHMGFFPLAVRCSQIYAFHKERMTFNSSNRYLARRLSWPFPRSQLIFNNLRKAYFSRRRFVQPGTVAFMRQHVSAVIASNLQLKPMQQFLRAARAADVRTIGYVGSWDHPVGKGVVYPDCCVYIVQNEYMRDSLVKFHQIPAERIEITGWPQTDLFAAEQSRVEYEKLISGYGLDSSKPCLLVAGNTKANAPYEPRFLERLVRWWRGQGGPDKFSIIARPHPKDIVGDAWRDRFASMLNVKGIYVQEPSYSDMDVLCLLLKNVDAVVTNAGTILLDSLANDRPVVCVLYDEGGAPGSRYALNNITGHHYKDIMASGAFHIGHNFDEVCAALERCFSHPSELAAERAAISLRTLGKIDGKASERVVDAILRHIPEKEVSS